jgi:hypothetical protein
MYKIPSRRRPRQPSKYSLRLQTGRSALPTLAAETERKLSLVNSMRQPVTGDRDSAFAIELHPFIDAGRRHEREYHGSPSDARVECRFSPVG